MPDKANTKVQVEQSTVKEAVQPAAESKPNKYRDGRWSVPSKRDIPTVRRRARS